MFKKVNILSIFEKFDIGIIDTSEIVDFGQQRNWLQTESG